ncbi:MAG: shikimate dehydrogenase [Acidobacteria bacterium]|nr:shikimate dehydrogenase [Acidobacteriota bacterium]
MSKPGTPSIFVSIAGPTIASLEEQAGRVSSLPVGYELRLDYLQDFTGLECRLRELFTKLHLPHVIATCRRAEAGGQFSGDVEQQISVLQEAVRAGCRWADVEIESVDAAGPEILKRLAPGKLIVSYHNYEKTPALGAIYKRLSHLPVQVVKIATLARHLQDNLKIAKLAAGRARRSPKLVALGLGPSGLPARLLAIRWGCPFTYASAGNNSAVAPGQLPAEMMRSTYRVDRLDRRTALYGVVGSHAAMSLSPAMHNAAFQAKHVNAAYLPCQTSRIRDFLNFARQMGFQGFSVTMPYKRAIIEHLDWLDPLARRIGACNTVAIQRGKRMGWNTDAAAVVEVLAKRLRLSGSRILILGAGGVARAAAFALLAERAELLITARRPAAAERLAKLVSARSLPWDGIDNLDVDVVVNATPIGMPMHAESTPIDISRLRVRVVFDMVYYPLETRLLAEARSRGLTAISGLEMLVAQGARQFEIWTGLAAPRALMEQAVRQTLDHSPSG